MIHIDRELIVLRQASEKGSTSIAFPKDHTTVGVRMGPFCTFGRREIVDLHEPWRFMA